MHITYRPATAEDLEPATRIVQDAYNGLRVRHGLAPTISLSPPLFQTFSLAEPSPGGRPACARRRCLPALAAAGTAGHGTPI